MIMIHNRSGKCNKHQLVPTHKHSTAKTSKQSSSVSISIDTCLSAITREVEAAKDKSHNGKVPYGFVTALVEERKKFFPWLTKDMVRKYGRKKTKKATATATSSNVGSGTTCRIWIPHPGTSSISMLTDSTEDIDAAGGCSSSSRSPTPMAMTITAEHHQNEGLTTFATSDDKMNQPAIRE